MSQSWPSVFKYKATLPTGGGKIGRGNSAWVGARKVAVRGRVEGAGKGTILIYHKLENYPVL
jgi:hypothetical protein